MPSLGYITEEIRTTLVSPTPIKTVITPPPEIRTTLTAGQGPAGPAGPGGSGSGNSYMPSGW